MLYREAEDKIIQAYFRDEIKPMDSNFCFCGTLHGGSKWQFSIGERPYTYTEYKKMERALFIGIQKIDGADVWHRDSVHSEEALFNGMCKALEVLKQIHIDRGENIDPVPFKKRELVKAL